jgi:hypothetical protein
VEKAIDYIKNLEEQLAKTKAELAAKQKWLIDWVVLWILLLYATSFSHPDFRVVATVNTSPLPWHRKTVTGVLWVIIIFNRDCGGWCTRICISGLIFKL